MKRPIRRALFGATVALSVFGLAAAPAGALEVGTSAGGFNQFATADVSPLAPLPLCLQNTDAAVLTINNTPVVGAGSTTATITIAAGALHFNPGGTFTDSSCLVPGLVPATLTITGAVGCSGSAQYGRVAAQAGLTVSGSCGGQTWVFEASQQPCFPDFPLPDPCAVVGEWVGVYQAIP
jgi:hypothetical protein